MPLYVVSHTHEYGVSSYLLEADNLPSEDDVVKALGINYEPEKGEEIIVSEVCQPKKILTSGDNVADEDESGEECDFSVTVCRIAYGYCTINVRSRSKKEAGDKALEMAGNYEFSTHNADYAVEDVTEI